MAAHAAAAALDLCAASAQGSFVVCAATGTEIECPLTAPVEGVHAWEGDVLKVPRGLLPVAYTAVAWLRLDQGAAKGYGSLLSGGNSAALTISPDGLLGVSMADSPGVI